MPLGLFAQTPEKIDFRPLEIGYDTFVCDLYFLSDKVMTREVEARSELEAAQNSVMTVKSSDTIPYLYSSFGNAIKYVSVSINGKQFSVTKVSCGRKEAAENPNY